MSEKTEKATPHKLQKAKDEGVVSKSSELNNAVLLIALFIAAKPLGLYTFASITQLIHTNFLLTARIPFTLGELSHLHTHYLEVILSLWLPWALIGVVTFSLISILQTGFIWSFYPLRPDFKRLNPALGFKRLMSTKALFDGFKIGVKLVTICLLIFLQLHSFYHNLNLNITLEVDAFLPIALHLMGRSMLQILLLLLVLSSLDKGFSSWKFAKEQRMSKHDIKDEYRKREGDPTIKAKIRQLQQALRYKITSLNQLPTADVLITHTDQYALALAYDKTKMPAPTVVYKAEGIKVLEAKKLASHHQIAVVEHKTLAEALSITTKLNQVIAKTYYRETAAILRDIYRHREQNL